MRAPSSSSLATVVATSLAASLMLKQHRFSHQWTLNSNTIRSGTGPNLARSLVSSVSQTEDGYAPHAKITISAGESSAIDVLRPNQAKISRANLITLFEKN